MKKTLFVNKEQLEKITQQFPTPFHLYDEKGMPGQGQSPEGGVWLE